MYMSTEMQAERHLEKTRIDGASIVYLVEDLLPYPPMDTANLSKSRLSW